MPLDPSVSPAFTQFCAVLYQSLLDAGATGFLGPAGDTGRPVVRRKTAVVRSDLQKALLDGVRAGLMRRGRNGRFIGLDPRLKAKLKAAAARRKKARAIPRSVTLARQREILNSVDRR